MIILKSAFLITLQRTFEIVLNIVIFRTTQDFVNNITGFSGIYSLFLTIFINNKARQFIYYQQVNFKKIFFPKRFLKFDWKLLVGHDLNRIFSTNCSETANEEVQSIRADFIQLKNEMGNHIFEFIFKSATQSSLIILFTIIFSDYLKNNYGINIYTSFAICISFSFVISFVSSLNYAKILLIEWSELLNDLEKTNNNRRLVLYVYGKSANVDKSNVENDDTSIIESSDDLSTTLDQRKPQNMQELGKTKNSKEKLKLDQFMVGIVSNEIEKEKYLKVKLMLLNPKFTEIFHILLENFILNFIPQLLLNRNPSDSPNSSDITGNSVRFLEDSLLLNSLATNDSFYRTKTLKECSAYVTDYYNVDSRLSNYLTSRGFKIYEKWTEYNMFLFIKFKVYEFKRSFSNLNYPATIVPLNKSLKNE